MESISDVEILLVEDNPNDVALTLRAMEKNNIVNKIKVLVDGEQALDYIFSKGEFEGRKAHKKPRFILLDLKLPKIDGLEVLKELKSNLLTAFIPVVVLTSSREEKDIIESYQLGVNSYIVKPVDFEQFTNSVKEIGLYWLVLNQTPNLY
ncbi:MAG: response regulator [Bacteroidetes bacterium]|nr:response regulator [Bacteroidota bacterium]